MRVHGSVAVVLLLTSLFGRGSSAQESSVETPRGLRAGAFAVDVTPQQLPVIRNGGFLEATDSRVLDPLHARAIVLDDGQTRIAIVVVDSCMIPLDVCDLAKELAHRKTGIAIDRIMISATHTHSAPSVMDFCLGSRADETYRKFLPAKIAEAIEKANAQIQPATIGFAVADASTHTKCRRFITRSDKKGIDPFGEQTIHAMMHPGHLNPAYIGPSGPIDPWLSLLSVRSQDDDPIAVFANFSMHYFGGHAGISADYYGRFCNEIEERLAPGQDDFVAIMSQGTSGDLWWGDYSVPQKQKPFNNIEGYVASLVDLAMGALKNVEHQADLTLAMSEKRLVLPRRTPDESRLAWAKRLNKLRGDRPPKDRPEVYAKQAVYLHDNPVDDVVLQAIRIGDVAITGMPNEVYALTGLKLKRQSPLTSTFNISLANGACGYIPPPEQHALGGYTTWPATTAGLEVQAEPKIVATLMGMLESISGHPRRIYQEAETVYSRAIGADDPIVYWRFAELAGRRFANTVTNGKVLRADGDLALHLPGRTHQRAGERRPHESHSVQLAGGKLVCDNLPLISSHTVQLSFRLGTPTDFRAVTAILLSHGSDKLEITGNAAAEGHFGRLQIGEHVGPSVIQPRQWYHLSFVRNGDFVQVYLDNVLQISKRLEFSTGDSGENAPLCIGGDSEDSANFEGRIDEVSVFNRALTFDQIARHLQAFGVATTSHLDEGQLDSSPLDPTSSLEAIHVRDGFHVELVAAEPLIQDPVAIDWASDGSLWVAEMADYPMGIDGRGRPGGRVRVLRDTTGDGRYDSSTVFLDGISFPTGLMTWGDGVLVTAAPEIFYAEDTDGNDVADIREPLLSGFVEGNQQLRVNGLRWGLDGWVYCASGSHHAGFGATTRIYSKKLDKTFDLGSRDFRFRPNTGEFEPVSGPSQFGRVRDDFGNWFGVQNSQPLWHYVLDERYVKRNPYVPTIDPRNQVRTPRMPRLYSAKPPQKRFHGFEHAGHYTSACGISIYRDNILFPRDEIHAFTCAPFHNLVQHHVLHHDGSSFRGERADHGPIDFFASTDRWMRPVMSRTGPDGALWIVDMYRYMIEHPEWLPESARKELEPGYRAGDQHGRIYRVVRDDRPARPLPAISTSNPDRLADHIGHVNGIIRDLAHRELLQHPTSHNAIDSIRDLVHSNASPESRVQAIRILNQIGNGTLPAECIADLLSDDEVEVRRAVISISLNNNDSKVRSLLAALASDANDKIRFQLALAAGANSDRRLGKLLAELATHPGNDRFMNAAIVSSAPRHFSALTQAVVNDQDVPNTVVAALISIGNKHDPDELANLLTHFAQGVWPIDSIDQRKLENISHIARWLESLAESGESLETIAAHGERLGNAAKSIQELIEKLRDVLATSDLENAKSAACTLLGRQASHFDADAKTIATLVTPLESNEIQQQAISTLARIPTGGAADELLGAYPTALPATRASIVEALLSRTAWEMRLLSAIENGSISSSNLSLSQQQRLKNSRNSKVKARSATVLTAEGPSRTKLDRNELVREYASQISVGDPSNGQKLFHANCQVCHSLDRQEALVGPDLRALTNRSATFLLTAILSPSESVDPRYANYQFVLTDGRTLIGVVTKEDSHSIELQMADGKQQTVTRASIEAAFPQKTSLMPGGFETRLSPSDMSDLISYVQSL